MDEVTPINYGLVQSDSISDFSNFLSDVSSESPKMSLSIIPNIIKDIGTIAIEFKKLKYEDKQFQEKCKIISRNMDIKEHKMKNDYQISVLGIQANTNIELNKIQSEKEVSISQINAQMNQIIETIESNEIIKLAEIKQQYDITMQKQKDYTRRFNDILAEDIRRFDQKMKLINGKIKQKNEIRNDLKILCNHIKNKITNKTATQEDFERYTKLMEIRMKSFDENTDIPSLIIELFVKGVES